MATRTKRVHERTVYKRLATVRGFKLKRGLPPAVPGALFDPQSGKWYLGDMLLTNEVLERLRLLRKGE